MGEEHPIRVLQVIGIVCGGGVEAVIMNYYRHIDRNKVQFDFVVDGYGKSLLDDEIWSLGGKVYKVEPYNRNIFKYMYQIYHIVHDNHYDIVHSNMNTLSVFSLFPAWLGGAKIRILHNHSTAAKGEKIRTALKYVLRPLAPLFANRYAACSKVAGGWMYGKKMMKTGSVKIINNAIDVKSFAFRQETRGRLRKELGIREDALVVGHVGRFMYQKNHVFLVDVFNEVHKKKSNALLVLIGDGELQPAIKNKVNSLGLRDSVKFMGLRDDVKDLYNIMDVFVLPSWYEGLPVVAVEAQANGLRCIFSDRVTYESKLVVSSDFLSLERSAEEWAELILHDSNGHNVNAFNEITDSGFDIISAADKMVAWYDTLAGNIYEIKDGVRGRHIEMES